MASPPKIERYVSTKNMEGSEGKPAPLKIARVRHPLGGPMSRFTKTYPKNPFPLSGGESAATNKRKPVPHEFVLDALAEISPWTRPMFGCLAVYVKEKIVLILRNKPSNADANGVWLATTQEHHESLRRDFPSMRSIAVLGPGVTGWQILPAEHADFESAALRACELILAGDPRIGKVPGSKRPAHPRREKKRKTSKAAKRVKKSAKKR
jgi:hypothetical protein